VKWAFELAKETGRTIHIVQMEIIDPRRIPDHLVFWWKRIGEIQAIDITRVTSIDQQAAKIIRSIGERCKARNMTLLYHNHDFEFNKVDGEYILDIFYSEIGADLLQTELDTCWVNVGGENPSEYMLKYTGRSPIVHLKDFIGQKTDNMYALIGNNTAKEGDIQEFQYRPVGYGRQDIPSILASAEKVGAKWAIVEQDKATMEKTPLECAEMSIKYLKSLEA
jgi:sugar phosphate isomerase/epimerase